MNDANTEYKVCIYPQTAAHTWCLLILQHSCRISDGVEAVWLRAASCLTGKSDSTVQIHPSESWTAAVFTDFNLFWSQITEEVLGVDLSDVT